ncbi:ImuA family protein [Magnetospira sp. QH-2]|uniref:ImuA family protein n=1 Tax=Magnetospira sp. (strain QH-2) TaxID=1288970 RepID=UPI0003E816D7|nr:hypothetical protein [Magnetospira sp. QH-2]CCQ73889.1 Conserved protein of unknown function [Magnetospira sp. QH-2]
MDRQATLVQLRSRLRALESTLPANRDDLVSLGHPALDDALPWQGLPRRGLHEIGGLAAPGFAIALLVRLLRGEPERMAFWCRPGRDLHAQGLLALGLDPERLVLVQGERDQDLLWAMEEGLRGGLPVAVLGEVAEVPPLAGRRLQLAAEKGGLPALLLRPAARRRPPVTAALTRWRIDPAPSFNRDRWRPCWRVSLQRCRGNEGQGQWTVEWKYETGDFSLAAPVRDRTPAAAPAIV